MTAIEDDSKRPGVKTDRPRKRRIVLISLLLLACLLTTGLAALFSFLYFIPLLANRQLAPILADIPGIEHVSLEIRKADPFGLDAAAIHVGTITDDAVSIESARLETSPVGLVNRRLKKLVLSGVTVSAEWDGQQLLLPGIDLNQWAAVDKEKDPSAPPPTASIFGFSLSTVEIVNGRIELDWLGRPLAIPFDVTVTLQDLEKLAMSFSGSLTPLGQRITVSATTKDIREKIAFHIRALKLSPGGFADLVPSNMAPTLKGDVDLSIRATVSVTPFRLDDVYCEALWTGMKVDIPGAAVYGPRPDDDRSPPFRMTVSGGTGSPWKAFVSGVTVDAGTTIGIQDMRLSAIPGPEGLKAQATLTLTAPPGRIGRSGTFFFKTPVQLPAQLSAMATETGTWKVQVRKSTEKDIPLEVSANGTIQHSRLKAFSLSALGNRKQGEIRLRIHTTGTKIDHEGTVVEIPEMAFDGDCRLERQESFGISEGTFTLSLSSPKVRSKDFRSSLTAASLSGMVTKKDSDGMAVSADLRFSGGTVREADRKFEVTGVKGSIPLHWPVDGYGKKGTVTVAEIRSGDRSLGSVTMDIRQNGSGITINGRHQSGLLPGLSLLFSGNTKWLTGKGFTSRLDMETQSPPYHLNVDFGRFSPTAEGIRMECGLSASGQMNWGPAGPEGLITLRLEEGSLQAADQKVTVEGIETALTISDLATFRSEPQQRISFTSARIGNLTFETGGIDFQVEPGPSLFIEKAEFNWCGGKVDAHAMRISPEVEDYHLVMYCDRLILSEILEQIGSINAEGKGTVNGKIPLHLVGGHLSFNDGFLYSTPGDGGTIRLSGTEMLTAGIPPNTLQYAQLELARAALSDYRYQWAKLGLNTEGETLILRLQMDGKPARSLPFVYKKEFGGFVKVEAGAQGSTFQGISLDVNFNLPLDKILQYQDIFKQMK